MLESFILSILKNKIISITITVLVVFLFGFGFLYFKNPELAMKILAYLKGFFEKKENMELIKKVITK
jgi:hypothetical protein